MVDAGQPADRLAPPGDLPLDGEPHEGRPVLAILSNGIESRERPGREPRHHALDQCQFAGHHALVVFRDISIDDVRDISYKRDINGSS